MDRRDILADRIHAVICLSLLIALVGAGIWLWCHGDYIPSVIATGCAFIGAALDTD